MVGIRDVAKKAGVSVSTVSLVINNNGYVSDNMRARVEKAMQNLNYVPNELARNFFRNRTNIIGLIVPTIRHPFFGTFAAAVQHEVAEHSQNLMLCSIADTQNGELQYIDMLRRKIMDGIIMSAHTSHGSDFWSAIQRPIVAFDRYLGDGIASFGSDHTQGGHLIADLLIRTNARHVVMVGGPRSQFTDLGDNTTFPTVRYFSALEEQLHEAGIEFHYVEAGEVHELDQYAYAMHDVFEHYSDVDAVVSSDIGAVYCLREAYARGIEVPRDLQIIAYDGTYVLDTACKKVTCVVQDIPLLAKRVVDGMQQAIVGNIDTMSSDVADGTVEETTPVSLRLGETTRIVQ
ncbi:MAG: LacI family DNA-binding transcriptional regulator [Bifidobacteriaceae bacterium]|nr:LacI family DNA-binding transcriptional regulator [Bifidobacteriaceae bacterium]